MHIDWMSLTEVAVVSAAVAITVVLLVSFALVGLSTRSARQVGGRHAGRASATNRSGGTVTAALCLLAAAVLVGYGLYVIVA